MTTGVLSQTAAILKTGRTHCAAKLGHARMHPAYVCVEQCCTIEETAEPALYTRRVRFHVLAQLVMGTEAEPAATALPVAPELASLAPQMMQQPGECTELPTALLTRKHPLSSMCVCVRASHTGGA